MSIRCSVSLENFNDPVILLKKSTFHPKRFFHPARLTYTSINKYNRCIFSKGEFFFTPLHCHLISFVILWKVMVFSCFSTSQGVFFFLRRIKFDLILIIGRDIKRDCNLNQYFYKKLIKMSRRVLKRKHFIPDEHTNKTYLEENWTRNEITYVFLYRAGKITTQIQKPRTLFQMGNRKLN